MDAIIKANENLEESGSTQDWELIGKDLKKLQDLIKQLEILKHDMEENTKNTQNEVENANQTVDNNVIN